MKNYDKLEIILSSTTSPSATSCKSIYISNDIVKATLQYSIFSMLTYVKAKYFYIKCTNIPILKNKINGTFSDENYCVVATNYFNLNLKKIANQAQMMRN